MSRGRLAVCLVVLGQVMQGSSEAASPKFPDKPLRIVTLEPGGGLDLAARVIVPSLTGLLGQPVIVENRGGASGLIAAQNVAKASPDGYTLLFMGSSLWLAPLLQDKVPYDPIRDYSPVTLAQSTPLLLLVHPSVPVKSVKDLVALAKSRPGKLNYASGSTGASSHLAAELFKHLAGVDIVRIPYKGTGPGLNGVMGGEVQMMISNAAGVTPYVSSGRLNLLAITSAEPSALYPNLPTVAASGLPGYEFASLQGMLAPARTPVAIVKTWNQAISRVLNMPNIREKFLNAGVDVVASSPEQFAAKIKGEMTRMGKVISNAGIRAE